MKMKRLISVALILILVFSLASCSLSGGDKPDDNNSSEKIQETQTVEDKPIVDTMDEEEEIVEEEEEDSEDLPFMKILKSGNFYYEVVEEILETGEEYGRWYIVRIGDKECQGMVLKGSGNYRSIIDASTDKYYDIYDDEKQFSITNLAMPLRDFNKLQATETGTEEVQGEMWEYIEYSTSSGSTSRYYVKNDDIYCYLRQASGKYSGKLIIGYYLNISDNPSPSYFEIPTDYVNEDQFGDTIEGRN